MREKRVKSITITTTKIEHYKIEILQNINKIEGK